MRKQFQYTIVADAYSTGGTVTASTHESAFSKIRREVTGDSLIDRGDDIVVTLYDLEDEVIGIQEYTKD